MKMKQRMLAYFAAFILLVITPALGQVQSIGAINFAPMMTCTIGKTMLLSDIITQKQSYQNSEQVADFSGYELEILIRTATLNNSDFTKIQFTCYASQTDLLSGLNSSQISYGIGGIQIDYTKLQQGYYFSLPLYTGGLKIAARVDNSTSIWSFFDPFHWSLWIVILVTTLFVSIVTWIFEDSYFQFSFCKKKSQNSSQKGSSHNESSNQQRQQQINMGSEEFFKEDLQSTSSQHRYQQKLQTYQNFLEMLWQSFSSLFFASSIRLQKFSARIVFLGFWFVIIIVSATYVSNLTVLLNQKKNISQISSYSDIINSKSVKIYTFSDYIGTYINPSDFKGQQSSIFVTYPKTQAGQTQMIQEFYVSQSSDNVLNHVLIADFPIIQNTYSLYPCSTAVLYEVLNNYNYGIISKNQSVIKSLNSLLYTFIDDPYWLNLIQTYQNGTPLENSCFLYEQNIVLSDLAGLWVFIGVAIFIAILINRIEAYKRRREHLIKQKDYSDPQKSKAIFVKQNNQQSQIDGNKGDIASQANNTSVVNGKSVIEISNKLIGNQQINCERSASIRKDMSGPLNQQEINGFEENSKDIWSDFLMVSDYIHIPSKDIHLQAHEEIRDSVNVVEQVIKKRFNIVEENIIRIMKKCPIKANNHNHKHLYEGDKYEDKSDIKRRKDSFLKND